MDGRTLKRYLTQLCKDIDEGRPLRPFAVKKTVARVALPALLGLSSLGLTACLAPQQPQVIVVQRPNVVEICNDGVDNDGDGAVDCADGDCRSLQICPIDVALYAAVMPPPEPRREVCGDGIDNDRDGAVDCSDSDCMSLRQCAPPAPVYGVPLPPPTEICGDGVDNDRDGRTDCADDDCDCGAVAEYAAPFEPPENCHDGIDNDGDGAIDCGDTECPCAVALYGIPHRE